MRTLLAAFTAVLALVFAASGVQAQGAGVPDIERYVNSIRTLQARFVQRNPNGSVVQGTLYISRPGRMRFEYDAPSQTDKELVSACLAARTNSKGVVVPLSLRAENVSGLWVSSQERSSYTYGEGAFWGNLFGGSPYIYSCSRSALNGDETSFSMFLSGGLPPGRHRPSFLRCRRLSRFFRKTTTSFTSCSESRTRSAAVWSGRR